jgi:hypothetical protein
MSPESKEAKMSSTSYRHERVEPAPLGAITAALGFVGLGLFQLVLALGAPLGHAAWGGDSADLSGAQRLGSAVSVVFYAAACLVVLSRLGLAAKPRSRRLLKWGPWGLTVILAVAALANFASQSHWENYVLGPVAVVLAVLCAVVARAPGSDKA